MALPPNPGDAKTTPDDDPLGGMDPMAWLESLAKRQGANLEELTTSADLDVPTPPADSVIDEPGYTPGYESAAVKEDAQLVADTQSTAVESASANLPEVTSVSEPEYAGETQPVVASTTAAEDPLGGMDPMAWLESLAKRQGASADEFTTSADLEVPVPTGDIQIDEPGYTPGYDTSTFDAKSKQVESESAPVLSASFEPSAQELDLEPAMSAEDPLGDADPMAWLESLAKRQGANAEEFTTSANLDVPVPSGDVHIDEPGYTPGYETAAPSLRYEPVEETEISAADSEPLEAALESQEDIVAAEIEPQPERAVEEVSATVPTAVSADDPLAGMDPMAWLESLAKRQGANVEELTTSADLEVPMPPADSVIDEPGYVDYDPFSAGTKPRIESIPPEPTVSSIKEIVDSEPLTFEDSRQWLDTLAEVEAARQEEAVLDVDATSDLAGSTTGEVPELEVAAELSEDEAAAILGIGEAASATAEDPLGGMDPFEWLENLAKETGVESPDLLAAAADPRASVDVTALDAPTQPGALITTPEATLSWLEGLSDVDDIDQEMASGAEPSDMPAWLNAAVDEPDALASKPALTPDIQAPDVSANVPAWMLEKPEAEIGEDFFEFSSPVSHSMPPTAEIELTAEEIAALTMPSSAEDIDSWAEALDDEYDRRKAGDESIPDWYLEAMTRAEESTGPMAAVQLPPPAAVQPSEEIDEPLVPSELPDWLRTEDLESTTSVSASVPEWLQQPESDLEAPLGEGDLDWIKDVDPVEVPDWLKEASPAAAPSPVAQIPQSQPEVAPAAAVQTPPVPKTGRIKVARDYALSERLNDAMAVYQQLIDESEDLEDVRADLRKMVETKPKEPRVRRLLGDTHMRLNDLQAALDAYRSALDQL